jgi:hypothetical protein
MIDVCKQILDAKLAGSADWGHMRLPYRDQCMLLVVLRLAGIPTRLQPFQLQSDDVGVGHVSFMRTNSKDEVFNDKQRTLG